MLMFVAFEQFMVIIYDQIVFITFKDLSSVVFENLTFSKLLVFLILATLFIIYSRC